MNTVRKGLIGSVLLVSESLSNKLIGLVSTLILARVLMPQDFGLVAIAVLLLNFLEVMSKTGGILYLLRSDSLTPEDVNTSWTIDLLIKTPLAIIFSLLAPTISDYYGDDRLVNIIYVLSLLIFIQCLKSPGGAFLRREQNYLPIIKLGLIAKFISVVIAISIAIFFHSYWALVLGQFTNSFVLCVGSYFIHSHRPWFTLHNAKRQWLFSMWMIPQAIIGFFRTQLDTLLVSATFDKDVLGSYHIMKYLAFIPSAHIVVPATQPLLVELAKVKHSQFYLKKQFNVSFIVMMTIALPMVTLISSYHQLIISVLLGEDWAPYSSLFSIFCLLIISAAIFQQSMRILLVYGHTKTVFVYEVFSFVIIYSALFWVGIEDIMSFSKIRVGLEVLLSVTLFSYVAIRYTDIKNLFRVLYSMLPLLIGCAVASILADKAINFSESGFINLFIVCSVFYISFLLTLATLSFSLFKKTIEWSYINNLLVRILFSLVNIKMSKDIK